MGEAAPSEEWRVEFVPLLQLLAGDTAARRTRGQCQCARRAHGGAHQGSRPADALGRLADFLAVDRDALAQVFARAQPEKQK